LSSQTQWGRNWLKRGLRGLVENGHQGRPSSVKPAEQEQLIALFAEAPPETLADARDRVQQVTGKKFSLTGVGNLMRDKLKMRRRKAKQVPPRCDDPQKKLNKRIGVWTS
jgi:transposase